MKKPIIVFYVLGFVIGSIILAAGESSMCGAPVIECPRWSLPKNDSRRLSCLSATRKSLEDRTFSTLEIRIPFPGKHVTYGYFYVSKSLIENESKSLIENDDYTFWNSKDEHDFKYVSLQALPDMPNHSYVTSGGPISLYRGEDRYQCINPEGHASFLGLSESLPLHNVKEYKESFEGTHPNKRYKLEKRLDKGGFGEVWVAFQLHTTPEDGTSGPPNDKIFIVKRIMVEKKGNAAYLSGIREKYFGEIFLDASSYSGGLLSVKHQYPYPYEDGLNHISRYIESFGSKSKEIWLVFRHEGISLSKLLYTADDSDPVRHPSKWWRWLKTTKAGDVEMRSLIWQLLIALKSCHDRNITHRDIKPENLIICFEDQKGRCLKGSSGNETYITKLRIIDFGSAIEDFTIKHLYGAVGPSRDEQTYEYMPPEALLNATWYHGPSSITTKYDMWSVGVVILELVIGSPNVFELDAITHNLLDPHLEGWNEGLKKIAYKLRSFMELCILLPGSSAQLLTQGHNRKRSSPPATWKCSEEVFSTRFKSIDPLKIGFPNVWAMRLVRQLLVWEPENRLSVDDALSHPYFTHQQDFGDYMWM